MNDLIVSEKQDLMGKEIPVVIGGFEERIKCICDKTVAKIHNQPISEIQQRINDNMTRFKENIDFIDLKKCIGKSCTLDFMIQLGYAESEILQAEHIYLLSEYGYSELIRLIGTFSAWEIHDCMIDEYFQARILFV